MLTGISAVLYLATGLLWPDTRGEWEIRVGDLGKKHSPLWPATAQHTQELLPGVFMAQDSVGTI